MTQTGANNNLQINVTINYSTVLENAPDGRGPSYNTTLWLPKGLNNQRKLFESPFSILILQPSLSR